MMMVRYLLLAAAIGLLALAFALSPAPATATLEADLTVSHTVLAPSQVDVNTGYGVLVTFSFRHLGPSQETVPAVFSYTLTGPPECASFSRLPSDTFISFGSKGGLSFSPSGFCTTAGLKTFVSRAEFLPGPGVSDPDLETNVSEVTFDVLVVSGEPAGRAGIDLDGFSFTADLSAASGVFTITNDSTESGDVTLESVEVVVSASPGGGDFTPISSTTTFTPTLAAGTVLSAESVTVFSFSSSYAAPPDSREIRVEIRVKADGRAETFAMIEGFLFANPD